MSKDVRNMLDNEMLERFAHFRDSGIMMEVNRQILHPLGLEIGMLRSADGSPVALVINSYPDADAGVMYSNITQDMLEKHKSVRALIEKCAKIRKEQMGWIVQPMQQQE